MKNIRIGFLFLLLFLFLLRIKVNILWILEDFFKWFYFSISDLIMYSYARNYLRSRTALGLNTLISTQTFYKESRELRRPNLVGLSSHFFSFLSQTNSNTAFPTLICAIRLLLCMGYLFTHANYLESKSDHESLWLCLFVHNKKKTCAFCYYGNKYQNSVECQWISMGPPDCTYRCRVWKMLRISYDMYFSLRFMVKFTSRHHLI